jgi:hypothetical protein
MNNKIIRSKEILRTRLGYTILCYTSFQMEDIIKHNGINNC